MLQELFNEKVKKQELENELHMLRQDLEKVGIEWNQNETSQSSEDR
jgi:hypothetical protein